MKQRVMIGMALSSGTSLLLADEATTALDVTIEAQINRLITKLGAEYGTSILYVTHNLGVLSEMADRIMIMYAGRIFEVGKTGAVFGSPRHPYSAALLGIAAESPGQRQSVACHSRFCTAIGPFAGRVLFSSSLCFCTGSLPPGGAAFDRSR
jgi:ABC-type dipeptide/oligopeptide/nickel transport system ATPase component